MLTSNIWTKRNLVNSTISTLIDVVQSKGDDPYNNQNPDNQDNVIPLCLLIAFDTYSYNKHNPKFQPDQIRPSIYTIELIYSIDRQLKVVLIFRTIRPFEINNVTYSRKQFPVTVVYSITTYKA